MNKSIPTYDNNVNVNANKLKDKKKSISTYDNNVNVNVISLKIRTNPYLPTTIMSIK